MLQANGINFKMYSLYPKIYVRNLAVTRNKGGADCASPNGKKTCQIFLSIIVRINLHSSSSKLLLEIKRKVLTAIAKAKIRATAI